MSLVLHVDSAAWRRHLDEVHRADPDLVPVAKGNGYGFGLPRLAAQAARLGADTLAVGTAPEVEVVRRGDAERPGWSGDVVVLTPWRPDDPLAQEPLADPGVITTVSRVEDAAALARSHPGARVVLEVLTSMRRHGLGGADLAEAVRAARGLEIVGWTIHLPMVGDHQQEATDLATAALSAHRAPLWMSHLGAEGLDRLREDLGVPVRHRVGTQLWLGAPAALRHTSLITDLHRVVRGQRVGYWQRRVLDPRGAQVAVVSGGTAHGVAMESPTAAASPRQRLLSAAGGVLAASQVAVSPFTVAGRKRVFVEPPHMQSSLVWLPASVEVSVGEEVEVTMRATTALPDAVVME